MRNLLQYPLTNEDRLQVLRRLRAGINPCDLACGDLTVVVLDDLISEMESRDV